jgi:phage tail sheath gpL-like
MSEPRINASIKSVQDVISDEPQKVLIVNQGANGTATTGQLYETIGNDNSYISLFGARSPITKDIAAFKALNKNTQLDVIPLDNGIGVAATGTVTFTGTSTSAGSITLVLGSRKNEVYKLPIDAGTSAEDIATAFEVAITGASGTSLFSASAALGVLTITSFNAGEIGNGYGLELIVEIAGAGASITAPMAGGTLLPADLTNVFDVVGDTRYQTISMPHEYGTSTLTTFLENRFNTANDILDGVGFMTVTETLANLTAAGNAEDAKTLVLFGNRKVADTLYDGSAIFELNHVISAQFAAVRSLRLTEGADISDIVVSAQSVDQEGGPALASLPYHNSPFRNLPVIDRDKTWSLAEEEQLNTAGVSIFSNNKNASLILVSRVVTTYKTDVLGVDDETFKFLNAVDTSSGIREFYFDNLKNAYAQSRLTLGDVRPNVAMTNPKAIEAYCVGLYSQLSRAEFVLTEAGEVSLKFFKKNIDVVVTDLAAGAVRVSMRVLPVSQLRTIDLPIEVTFTV